MREQLFVKEKLSILLFIWMNNIRTKTSGASMYTNIGSEVNKKSINMYLKIVILAFFSTMVNGRPQFQAFQPGFQQTQTFEPFAYNRNVPILVQQEPVNPYFVNLPQNLPPNIHSRRAKLGPEDRHQMLHERLERLHHHHPHNFQIKPKNSYLHHHTHRFDEMPQQDETRQNIEPEMFTRIQTNYDNEGNYAIADSNTNAQQDPYMAANNLQKPNEEATTNTHVPFNQAISLNSQDVVTEKQGNIKSSGLKPGNDQNLKTVTPNENTSSLRSTNSERKPVTDAKSPIPIPRNKDEQGGKVTDKSTTENDRWVWGAADMTEKVPETTESAAVTDVTPDLDDRASFDGDACPAGKVRFGNTCVDKE